MKTLTLFQKLLLASLGIHSAGMIALVLTAQSSPPVKIQPLKVRHIMPFVQTAVDEPLKRGKVEQTSTPAKKKPPTVKESKKPKPSTSPLPASTGRKNPHSKPLSSESLAVPQLKDPLPLPAQQQKVDQASCVERLLAYLEQAVLLPEKEIVKAILTIDAHFKIENLALVECESPANRHYLMTWISFQLPFAEAGFQGTELTISFHGI